MGTIDLSFSSCQATHIQCSMPKSELLQIRTYTMILHSNLTSDSEHLRPQLNTPMSVWLSWLVSSCVTVTRPSPLQGSDKQGSIPTLYTLYAVITSLITQDGGHGRWCRPRGTGSSPVGSSPYTQRLVYLLFLFISSLV